jgi:hypothetical protein
MNQALYAHMNNKRKMKKKKRKKNGYHLWHPDNMPNCITQFNHDVTFEQLGYYC